MRLKLVQVGEEVLRQRARELSAEEIRSREIAELIDMMRDTLRDAPGVGLAAPQVGVGIQLAIIEDLPEYSKAMTAEQIAERERTPVPFHVIVNPKLTPVGDEKVEFFEGCLSVNGYTGLVPRYRRVRVECLDETCTASHDRSLRLVRAHSAARNRPPERHGLCRSHGVANADDD